MVYTPTLTGLPYDEREEVGEVSRHLLHRVGGGLCSRAQCPGAISSHSSDWRPRPKHDIALR